MTHSATSLDDRIAQARVKAATPAYDGWLDPEDVDIEAWDRVGDPLAEDLVSVLRERKLMGGDLLANARALRGAGDPVADAFFSDVEWVPPWADFEAMGSGAALGLRNPIGMMMSHGSLVIGYADNWTARVMAATDRMLQPQFIRRRVWESAVGFIGALDVDGMRPGGPRWEQWVRIRLLHTSIRMGILRSGRWRTDANIPISQTATGAGAHMFGTYRVNIIRHFGGRPTDEEAASFELMWRWIARIEGANSELLGRTQADQLRIAERIGDRLYRPGPDSRRGTVALIDGLARMKSTYPISRRAHAGIIRAILSDEMTQIFDGKDLASDLGLPPDAKTERAARRATSIGQGLTRLNAKIPSTRALELKTLEKVVNRGLRNKPPTFTATPVAGDRG